MLLEDMIEWRSIWLFVPFLVRDAASMPAFQSTDGGKQIPLGHCRTVREMSYPDKVDIPSVKTPSPSWPFERKHNDSVA